MARRAINIFGLSFLDALTCGFGAVILFYMIINASVRLRSDRTNADLQAEVDRLDVEVVEGDRALVELRNSARDVDDRIAVARGLASRILEDYVTGASTDTRAQRRCPDLHLLGAVCTDAALLQQAIALWGHPLHDTYHVFDMVEAMGSDAVRVLQAIAPRDAPARKRIGDAVAIAEKLGG